MSREADNEATQQAAVESDHSDIAFEISRFSRSGRIIVKVRRGDDVLAVERVDFFSDASCKRLVAGLAATLEIPHHVARARVYDLRNEFLLWASADEVAGANGAAEADAEAGEARALRERLIELVRERGELFCDPGETATYATLRPAENQPRATFRIGSRAWRKWLAGLAWRELGAGLKRDLAGEVEATLAGLAVAEGERHAAALRVAEQDGAVWIDLASPDWSAVRITPGGWSVVPAAEVPVRFVRAAGMQPLPAPTRGTLGELRELLHVADEETWALIGAWLVAAARPRGPYPVLVLAGEQGAGKSTTARMLRRLLDPNRADIRAEPKEVRDLMIASSNGWVVALDNLSVVWPWLSDALCRLATGGGFATRELYSDADEVIFDAQRPVILTGIDDGLVSRPDLADRAITVTLPPIPEADRVPEAELWRRYDSARPRLLGALCDAVALALRRLPGVRLDRLPRMADFALWASAAEPALGVPEGLTLAAYAGAQDAAFAATLEASPIVPPLLEFMAEIFTWQGTAKELLELLVDRAGLADRRPPDGWPKSPRGLAGTLRRLSPALRRQGLSITFPDDRRRRGHQRERILTITFTPGQNNTGERSSASSAEPFCRPNSANDNDLGADDCSEPNRPQRTVESSADDHADDCSPADPSTETAKAQEVTSHADDADDADDVSPATLRRDEKVVRIIL